MASKLPSEILNKPRSKRLQRLVNITSPTAFKRGLKEAKKGGFTREESRAFALGKGAASLQLKRKNLSQKERKQFKKIQKIKLPEVSK